MFDDVLSSSRGPGIIGTLLAIFVLAGFCGLGVAVFNDDGRGPARDAEIERQKEEIEELAELEVKRTKKLAKYDGFHAKLPRLNEARTELATKNALSSSLAKKVTRVKESIDDLGKSFHDYKNLYRKNERKLARGEIVDLSAARGERYKSVEISRIDAAGMRVKLESGPKMVPYQELPKSMQDRFQFAPDEAKAFREANIAFNKKRTEEVKKYNAERMVAKAESRKAQRATDIAEYRRKITAKRAYVTNKFRAASKYDRRASDYRRKANVARSQGRPTMNLGEAKKAEATAKRLRKDAKSGERLIKKWQLEVRRLSSIE